MLIVFWLLFVPSDILFGFSSRKPLFYCQTYHCCRRFKRRGCRTSPSSTSRASCGRPLRASELRSWPRSTASSRGEREKGRDIGRESGVFANSSMLQRNPVFFFVVVAMGLIHPRAEVARGRCCFSSTGCAVGVGRVCGCCRSPCSFLLPFGLKALCLRRWCTAHMHVSCCGATPALATIRISFYVVSDIVDFATGPFLLRPGGLPGGIPSFCHSIRSSAGRRQYGKHAESARLLV